MKNFYLFLISLLFSTNALSAANVGVTYNANILRVIDGDTVVIEASFLPAPLKKELSVRIYGVDTPEKGFRSKCPQEDQRSQAATQFTKQVITSSRVRQVTLYDWDKYGGRVLGDIVLDGKSLRVLLIQNNYAREYFGEQKQSWCN